MPPYSHRYWPSASVRGCEGVYHPILSGAATAKAELGPTHREGQQLRLGSQLHLRSGANRMARSGRLPGV